MKTSSSDAGTDPRRRARRQPARPSGRRDERHGIAGRAGPHAARGRARRRPGRRRTSRHAATGSATARAWSAAMTSTIVPGQLRAQRCRACRARASLPSCSSATRGQRSASSRYGVAITIVMPCARNSDEQLPELAPRHRIDAGRRLVEQDHARLVDQRAGERELLLHAARQAVGEPVRNGVSCVSSSSRVRRSLVVRAGRGSRRRTRCSRRCSGRRRG